MELKFVSQAGRQSTVGSSGTSSPGFDFWHFQIFFFEEIVMLLRLIRSAAAANMDCSYLKSCFC